ncbi:MULTISPECIES: type 1 periplasmic binding fold superfamily protein [unclassified Tenacibaculum]|uniref:type 1 periplasmic binding fold superfamily protein n=1 Tax=unclassified Tenacibaculum TaxID=2635139 RepID=UPI001F20BFC3|nr:MULTISPECIES: type 1 periplasmic binding fold superfamily protein [unclassified Tenacibaculum]MCF2875602.1 type 1 periplasmic binding fold superfamily protein [Tenacibaculum sp. Cn5-1]MCF2935678.1 type 1 periplasmic binding fold superfamily protein [Tenacibaculum sp. Cn5-34]MCG7512238.1 type 1 periplasmic binding fold superfamily protein [Tenacibaculum sp. Cn5-46]
MKLIKLFSILTIFSLVFASCSDSDPVPVNEEEVITTMKIVLTPNGGGNAVTIQSQDLDGDGPNVPVITPDPITLAANTTYSAVITLLNETESPAGNVTDEVAAEAEEHQFFYSANGITGTFTYAGNNDSNGNPVGIQFTVATGAAGTGAYTVTLKHEPNKSAAGVKDGDITNAGGSTDIEVSFPITLQ